MASIIYGTGAYRRENGNLPEIILKNMFVETVATSQSGIALLSREGLTVQKSVGSGPITGLFAQNNVFNNDVFAVSGGHLFRNTTDLGAIAGTGPVSFAAGSANEILVCAGAALYRYNGSSLSTVAFPDSANVSCVTFHDGLYIAAKAGTDRWYWSDPLDGSTWNALSFASAEARPDPILDIKVLSDFIILIGANSIERWVNTGSADIPYSRIEASILQRGALKTGVTTILNDTVIFVGDDGIVYSYGEGLNRLSDNGIEERISQSQTALVFGFNYLGHSFFCLRLDTGSFLYDLSTNQWCEFTTYDRPNWQARCACMVGKDVVLGDDTRGQLLTFKGWSDDDAVVERLFTALFPISGRSVPVDSLLVEANTGWTSLLAGQGTNPIVEMRSSIDAGATWNNWRSASLGSQGHYRARTRWTRCGSFDFPGAIFEIRSTDPVPFRVSNVFINEPTGGRGRGI